MKRFIITILFIALFLMQSAFAMVVQEIPNTAIPVDNGMYIVGENFPSGSYTFCIDLNEPEVVKQVAINSELDPYTDRDRYNKEHESVYAMMFLYKDYQTMLDDRGRKNCRWFTASDSESLHIVLMDGMTMEIETKTASRGYLVPDKTE